MQLHQEEVQDHLQQSTRQQQGKVATVVRHVMVWNLLVFFYCQDSIRLMPEAAVAQLVERAAN